ncbi:MAG: AAA family ATPase [Planctomycetaceae bacterium]|jgi:hypothetical protein|nr:AAA family ATPase [Planctomycetaceae bacterium]
MSAKKTKQLPYGNANIKKIRTNNCVYIDKTRFIELHEKESNLSKIFICPHRFGKCLFRIFEYLPKLLLKLK